MNHWQLDKALDRFGDRDLIIEQIILKAPGSSVFALEAADHPRPSAAKVGQIGLQLSDLCPQTAFPVGGFAVVQGHTRLKKGIISKLALLGQIVPLQLVDPEVYEVAVEGLRSERVGEEGRREDEQSARDRDLLERKRRKYPPSADRNVCAAVGAS